MSTLGLKAAPKIIEGVQQPELQYVDEPHGYTWEGEPVPYTSGIIKDTGLGTDFGSCTPEHLAYRARVGKAFHAAAHYLVADKLDPEWKDEVTAPHIRALRDFWQESKATPIAAEVSLYSQLHGFATTVDSVWILNGHRALIEYKTSDQASPAEEYQVWAQEIAWNEHFRNMPIEARFTLHVKKSGRYSLHDWTKRQAYNFTYLVWMFNERKRRGLPCHV